MNKKGLIIFIEDDVDDQDIITMVFQDLNYKNELFFFGDSELALATWQKLRWSFLSSFRY